MSVAGAIPGVPAYRGKRVIAGFLVLVGLPAILVGFVTLSLDDRWLAFPLMGVPALWGGAVAVAAGWAEWIAKIEFGRNSVHLHLCSWRGWLPCPPVQDVEVNYSDVILVSRRIENYRVIGFPFACLAYRIRTRSGDVRLVEPAGGGPRVMSAVAHEIAAHSGMAITEDDGVRGGGLIRTLARGSPRWP